jgi:hypothetical protein
MRGCSGLGRLSIGGWRKGFGVNDGVEETMGCGGNEYCYFESVSGWGCLTAKAAVEVESYILVAVGCQIQTN